MHNTDRRSHDSLSLLDDLLGLGVLFRLSLLSSLSPPADESESLFSNRRRDTEPGALVGILLLLLLRVRRLGRSGLVLVPLDRVDAEPDHLPRVVVEALGLERVLQLGLVQLPLVFSGIPEESPLVLVAVLVSLGKAVGELEKLTTQSCPAAETEGCRCPGRSRGRLMSA